MDNACQCGCGISPNAGKRFVTGHNTRGSILKPRVSISCKRCGGERTGTAAELRGKQFCGKSCRDQYRRDRLGAAHPDFSRVTVNCEICGSSFESQPARVRDKQYCSPKCGKEGHRRKLKSKPRRPPSGTCRQSMITQAKHRDKKACRICGWATIIHGHHIIPKAKGGPDQLDNLITLCPNHHAMAHAGLMTIDELLAAISS